MNLSLESNNFAQLRHGNPIRISIKSITGYMGRRYASIMYPYLIHGVNKILSVFHGWQNSTDILTSFLRTCKTVSSEPSTIFNQQLYFYYLFYQFTLSLSNFTKLSRRGVIQEMLLSCPQNRVSSRNYVTRNYA